LSKKTAISFSEDILYAVEMSDYIILFDF